MSCTYKLSSDMKQTLSELVEDGLLVDYNENYIIELTVERGVYRMMLENGNYITVIYDVDVIKEEDYD